MDSRRKEIEHLDAEIRRLEQGIAAECVEVGRRIASLDHRGVGHEELRKYLNSIDTLVRATDSAKSDIGRIAALRRQVDARAQEIGENTRRAEQLRRERESRFMELGAGAFTVFKTLPERESYRPVFEDLLRLDLESEHRNEELRALEAEEKNKGFFERLKLKAQKVILRGDISRLDRSKNQAYAAAGARIAETDFARHTEGALRTLFEQVQERKRAADGLGGESDLKVAEIERDRQELRRLGVEEDAEAPAREIQRRIDGMAKELDVMYCWTGQIYLERDLRRELPDGPLDAKFEIVAGMRESIRKKRQQMDRLKAELEIEEIARKEKERRARRKQLEEEMRVKERQIGVLDIEINMGLRRMEELKRVLTGEAPYTDAPPFPPTPDLYPPGQLPAPPKP